MFVGGEEVADDEGALVDPPESFALGEFGELVDLDGGEAEEFAGGLGFVEGFVVEDAGGGVGEESLGEASGLGAGVADGVEVGEAVDDHEVGEAPGAGEFPVGLHAGEQGGLGEEAPGFVVDDEAVPAGGVGQGGFHPGGGAGHDEADEGVGAGDGGQVEAEHGQGGVEGDGGGSVEESGEVAVDEAGEGVADLAAVVRVAVRWWCRAWGCRGSRRASTTMGRMGTVVRARACGRGRRRGRCVRWAATGRPRVAAARAASRFHPAWRDLWLARWCRRCRWGGGLRRGG